MKIHILSDLHNEFGNFTFPVIDRDLLLLAGDIDIGTKALRVIENECKKSPVIYILGNHEYYNQDFDTTLKAWYSVEIENFHFLENATAVFDNVRIIGATLWTDMNHRNLQAMEDVQWGMNDYAIVDKGDRPLKPEDTVECFDQSQVDIQTELAQKFIGKTIVLTHHLPTYRSIAWQFQGNPLNAASASDMDNFILQHKPDYWIHGHTHVGFDYMLGNTRIICNPRGYYGQEVNPTFKPDLILDI